MNNIVWHQSSVTKEERHKLNQHKSFVLWFTGLSGSGKSTIANEVDRRLYEEGIRSYVLDGDNIRHGLNKGLGFTKEDRIENMRRIGEVSKLFVDSGQIVLTAFISPFREDRKQIRALFPEEEFFEVFIHCPLNTCEQRDPKGLYAKARRGEIVNFTGIDSPYEPPINPEITINTDIDSITESCDKIIDFLNKRNVLRTSSTKHHFR